MANVTITPSNVVPPTANTTLHYQPASTIAGEAINAGETVCLFGTTYFLGDANDTDKQDIKGVAGNSAAIGQRVDIITASPALAVGAHAQTVGTPLFQSATPGKLCPYADLSSGAVPVLLAYAATSTTLQVVIAKSQSAKP